MKYDLVCGFETHIELSTEKKMFCPCRVEFGSEPNTNCCSVCIGAPGTLPVLNREVVNYAVKMGLALNCEINLFSKMERKCYFYPDLSKAYQITQNDMPICGKGFVTLNSGKKIRINHIHIEEDAGKIKNESDGIYVDYNRGGVPLIEIVSEPDIASPDEAQEYIEKLQLTARYLRISDARMQEGSVRCDVNISVKPSGSSEFGTRIEIKNMNSISFICKALKYEYDRQVDAIESGEKLIQETRRFNESTGKTESMRGKENAGDYGYFPEPDLSGVCLTEEEVNNIRNSLPEMYDRREKRYIEMGIPEKTSGLLVKYVNVSDFFDSAINGSSCPVKIANLIVGPIFSFLGTELNKEDFNINVSPEDLNYLTELTVKNKISSANAKEILVEALETGKDLRKMVEQAVSESCDFDLNEICKQCISENPEAFNDLVSGKEKVLQFIIGKIMAMTKGKANISEAKSVILKLAEDKKSQ